MVGRWGGVSASFGGGAGAGSRARLFLVLSKRVMGEIGVLGDDLGERVA